MMLDKGEKVETRRRRRRQRIAMVQHYNRKKSPPNGSSQSSCNGKISEDSKNCLEGFGSSPIQVRAQTSPTRLTTCAEYQKLISTTRGSLARSVARGSGKPHDKGSRMLRLIKWPLVHLCLPLCLATLLLVMANCALAANPVSSGSERAIGQQFAKHNPAAPGDGANEKHPTRTDPFNLPAAPPTDDAIQLGPAALAQFGVVANWPQADILNTPSRLEQTWRPQRIGQFRGDGGREIKRHFKRRAVASGGGVQKRARRSPVWPISGELRANGGSKLEPPSRPSQDRSPKQRPYFGTNLQRNVSVELGKTAQLVCKVFELGDKTVSWLRPRENEILTAGEYVYVSDPRISAANELGSPDWLLEIKDVGLNDSDSYECQVSTDPKLSLIFNLHVQAARARIKSGENNYYPVGANLEFACEILAPPTNSTGRSHRQDHPLASSALPSSSFKPDQIYWYHNGNLLNYANTLDEPVRRENFSIEWDRAAQLSRLKLSNIQLNDSGNYTCKPTSAEPATVRLFVKKHRHGTAASRAHYSGGGAFHLPNGREAQRTRQQHDDFAEASSSASSHNLAMDSFALALATSLISVALLNVHRLDGQRN